MVAPDDASSFSAGEQLSFLTKHADHGTKAVYISKRSKNTISWELDSHLSPEHYPLGPLSVDHKVGQFSSTCDVRHRVGMGPPVAFPDKTEGDDSHASVLSGFRNSNNRSDCCRSATGI